MEQRIISDLKDTYGITFTHIAPVTGGLLNRKWKISTDQGELLVKQYSTTRFSREQLERIEAALQRQILLKKQGVPCPSLRQCGGRAIRWLDDQTAYIIMDFCSGKTENPDTISMIQMYSLGSTCAHMHQAFSQLPAHGAGLPGFGGYTLDLLREYFISRIPKSWAEANGDYQNALFAAEVILKQIPVDFFDALPKGFAHEDIQPGNILFDAERVSAIIDFDRNCFSYIWHDIGRAILSFALEGNTLNINKVIAFQEGYSQFASLTLADMADALRLTWCIEVPWWIRPQFFAECDAIPKRFKEEMLWLTEHWFELNSLSGS